MKTAHVLVVDDEPNIRLMVRTTLEAVGHTVAEAENGRAALDRIDQDKFDLVVLDLSMPVLDGMSTLEALRGRTGPVPRAIVLTAYGSIAAAVRATLLGASNFIEKPSTPAELRTVVEQTLASVPPTTLTMHNDVLAGGYEAVLDRIREALTAGAWENAESLLMKAADLSLRDAAYFNLLGVLYEARRQLDLAGKFYRKAMAATRGGYSPAEQNLRRLYEFQRFGKSQIDVDLGERPAVLLRYR
jgi:CheY-like chemotaxis protein